MPLAVRIAFGWFVLLTVASVMPSVYEVLRSNSDGTGFDRLISALVCNVGMAALCMGFALAVVRRKWSWVRVPYLVIGAVVVLALCLMIWREPAAELALCLGLAVAMTAFPLVMLELPSAVRWRNAVPRKSDRCRGADFTPCGTGFGLHGAADLRESGVTHDHGGPPDIARTASLYALVPERGGTQGGQGLCGCRGVHECG